MNLFRIAAMTLLLGVVGCAAYGGATLLTIPMDVSAPRGVTLRPPDAIKTAAGARFHGAVCRRALVMSPTRIRVERIDISGVVVASASRALSSFGRREGGCRFYDVPTDWTIGAGERVRVCALQAGAACPAPQAGS